MVVVSYSGKEINAKLVYYGPGLCGKTTNLEHVYDSIPSTHRGKMVSMKTRTERTLFFDFLPVDLGELGGFKTRFLLYTVPGQVYYNATRKLVLRGVDAVVFVADSARGKMNENLESLENLKENLREYGLDLNTMPWVLQFNKRDLPDTYTIEEMNASLNPGGIQHFEAVATNGTGVFETLKGVSRLLLEKLSKEVKLSPKIADPGIEARKAMAESKKAAIGLQPTASAASDAPLAPSGASSSSAAKPVSGASATPSSTPAVPSTPAGVRASAPAPVASKSAASAAAPSASSVLSSGSFESNGGAAAADPAGPKPGFGQKLARMFGFGKKESEPFDMSAPAARSTDPPAAAPAPPRAAVVTSGSSTRISRVDPAPAKPSPAPVASVTPAVVGTSTPARAATPGSIEKRISVPVSLELTAEEMQSGARLRLILDIDLSTMQATVERDRRTGTS